MSHSARKRLIRALHTYDGRWPQELSKTLTRILDAVNDASTAYSRSSDVSQIRMIQASEAPNIGLSLEIKD